MERIVEAIGLGQGGERQRARLLFGELWHEVGAGADPFHRCSIAHFMADLQDDPRDELAWDLRALDAAAELTDQRVGRYHESLSVRGFYPSLHLNVAEAYRKTGELDRAAEHLALATASQSELPDEGYGRMIRSGVERLSRRPPETDLHL